MLTTTATFERRIETQRKACNCDITAKNRYFDVNENFCERSNVMKKLLVLMMLLAMSGAASASIYLTVDSAIDPPDTQINIAPGSQATIGIWGDGSDAGNMAMWLTVEGNGSLTGDGTILYNGSLSAIFFRRRLRHPGRLCEPDARLRRCPHRLLHRAGNKRAGSSPGKWPGGR